MSKFEYFLIYLNNLSSVYIVNMVTVFVVILVTFYCSKIMNKSEKIRQNINSGKNITQSVNQEYDYEEDNPFSDEGNSNQILSKMKSARLRKYQSFLTHDQIEEERKVEREQLAAIFDLLKQQEAETNNREISEDELRAQLSLYR